MRVKAVLPLECPASKAEDYCPQVSALLSHLDSCNRQGPCCGTAEDCSCQYLLGTEVVIHQMNVSIIIFGIFSRWRWSTTRLATVIIVWCLPQAHRCSVQFYRIFERVTLCLMLGLCKLCGHATSATRLQCCVRGLGSTGRARGPSPWQSDRWIHRDVLDFPSICKSIFRYPEVLWSDCSKLPRAKCNYVRLPIPLPVFSVLDNSQYHMASGSNSLTVNYYLPDTTLSHGHGFEVIVVKSLVPIFSPLFAD